MGETTSFYDVMWVFVGVRVGFCLVFYRFYGLVEGSFEVKLPTVWTDGIAEAGRVREEKKRREKIREEKESEERRRKRAKR